MSRLMATALALPGLHRVERQRLADERGFFSRVFCADELASAGWIGPVVQINHTLTARRGTIRGLHYQHPPHAEMKLVSCLRGEVWDVAVDLRSHSPTFLQWHAERLSGENGRAMVIPRGFAHGFQTLTDDAELLYCHSAAYAPAAEAGLHPLDVRLAIAWPLHAGDMSPRDAGHAMLTDRFEGVPL